MGRKGLLTLGATLFTALVVGLGAFVWVQTESRLLGATEAEGRALLRSVAAGIRGNLEAASAMERLLAERLLGLAPVLEADLAAAPGREAETLVTFARDHGLSGALLLDADLGLRAAAAGPHRPAPSAPGGPFSASRLDRLESGALARRAREAGLAERDRVVLGFGERPLRARTEFLVGARAPTLGGFVILQLPADALASFREEAGVRRMLRAAVVAEAIDYLVIIGSDGVVLAADDPTREGRPMEVPAETGWRTDTSGARVLDVALPAPWEGPPEGALHVGLAAGPVEAVLVRARTTLVVSTLLVLLMGHGGLTLIVLRERRVRRQEARLRRELEIRERFAALGRLAAGVAHEIRSPLNALSMAAQRLRRESAPAEGPERERFEALSKTLRDGIARLDARVEEFLALGRPARPPEIRSIDPGPLVGEVVASEGGAEVRAPAPPVLVRADAELLGKALANLVRNACQAAPDGTVSVAWETDGDGQILFAVEDDGPGVPEAEREAIFEPFRTTRAGGTGLGLAIARDAVESQDGEIRVEAAAGGGARFTIRLPAGGDV